MKFKILAILVIFVFCVYDFAYSHSGRTNSAGFHNVTVTGSYHCHGGGNGSDIYLLLGFTLIIIGVGYWAYTTDWGKNPQGCLLSQTLYNQLPTRSLFNQTPMRIPVSGLKPPYLNLDRQGFSGW